MLFPHPYPFIAGNFLYSLRTGQCDGRTANFCSLLSKSVIVPFNYLKLFIYFITLKLHFTDFESNHVWHQCCWHVPKEGRKEMCALTGCNIQVKLCHVLSIFWMKISSKINPQREIASGLRVLFIPPPYISQCQKPHVFVRGISSLQGVCVPFL